MRQETNITRRGFVGAGAKTAAALAALGAPAAADAATHPRHAAHKKKHRRHKPKHAAGAPCDAAPTPATAPPGGRIDLHAHHIPPDYRVALLEAGQLTIAGYPTPVWTPQRAIGVMDNYGIGTQVLSLSDPGVSFLSGSKAASLARSVNEYTAGLIAQYPARFGGFAVLPLPDIAASLTELDYALHTLKLDGVGLLTSYAGQNIALPQFAPIWEAIAAAGAFVFMHPASLPPNEKPASPLPDFLVEFTFDTTRFVTLALYTGLFDLRPNLRIQLAHAGGCYPYLSWRVSVLTQGGLEQITQNPHPTLNGVLPGTPTKGLYYDTALAPPPQVMQSILEMSDLEHIVFGSDWPFTELLLLTKGDPQPQLSLSFNEAQRHTLERANALTLLPSLAKRLAAA